MLARDVELGQIVCVDIGFQRARVGGAGGVVPLQVVARILVSARVRLLHRSVQGIGGEQADVVLERFRQAGVAAELGDDGLQIALAVVLLRFHAHAFAFVGAFDAEQVVVGFARKPRGAGCRLHYGLRDHDRGV